MSPDDAETVVPEVRSTFPTTHWTAILAAGRNEGGPSRALEAFCGQYWQPVFRHVCWRGYSEADAKDLTQGFFAKLLEKETLTDVTQEGGRFRSFLLASLGNFLANERRRGQAAKRGGGRRLEELDALDSSGAAADPANSADWAFDREWALALLERALARLREEYRREKGRLAFEALHPLLTGAGERQSLKSIGEKLGMSEANVKVSLHRMRKRFGEILREEVGATVASPADVPGEIQLLAEVAARST